MSFTEDLQILSLFSDEVSLWGQLPEDGGLSPRTDFDSHLKAGELSSGYNSFADPLSPGQESDVSGDDPLPQWMSDKVPLSAWLGDEEDIPMADLMTVPAAQPQIPIPTEAEELFKELLVDANIAPTPPSPGEDQSAADLLALSPVDSLLESMSESASPVASPVTFAPGGDLEAQALALLDSMGCMDFSSDQDTLDAQVITVTLPLPTEHEEEESTSSLSIQSPVSVQSLQEESPLSSPAPTPVKRTRSKPKLKNASPIDRKSRKRGQNKEAATRYRVKKRAENETLADVLGGLEGTNKGLKKKVEGLESEIKYLKDLLIEVRTLKGQINAIKKE